MITINIPEESIINAYAMIRTLFGFIQNWKGTKATFRGKEVHPYQFILHAHQTGECASITNYDKKNCLTNRSSVGWSCKKLDNIYYDLTGNGNYKTNGKYWYNYGYFKGKKWIIDKQQLAIKLMNQVSLKGLDLCPHFDQNNLRHAIENLPEFIIPDDITFKIFYEEKYIKGEKIMVPNNIRHQTNNFSKLISTHSN
ncbi:hypothetical protein [Flavicella sediminum]|uniref:hypothetical protein n=1 Tax=Flavicella sediminum TaxID=2585141 RepID=UPI001122DEB2|nr:hypothetical protein [Flavicella sediminum]